MTNTDVVYLDSSAFVKLFLPEVESAALIAFLQSSPHLVSAMLLRTEALRAAARAAISPQRMLLVRALLEAVHLIPSSLALSDDAGILPPLDLRSLDAIHLATARSLRVELTAFISYDRRLSEAAAWHGLPVMSPN